MDSLGCWVEGCSLTPTLSEGEEDEQRVRVFPNPTTGSFTLENAPDLSNYQIEILDLAGRSIEGISIDAQIVTLPPTLPNGFYILRLRHKTTQTIQNVKIVLQR